MQRAAELTVYLTQLAQHPVASQTSVLRFFLSLQDDLGAAWPDCSSNAFTRLANASVGAAVKASEQLSLGEPDSAEDSAELLALYAAESVRMGAVLQAVPKVEGCVTLLREHSEQMGAVGMEVGRRGGSINGSNNMGPDGPPANTNPVDASWDVLAQGLLRAARRSKRQSLELSAAVQPLVQQHKQCRYERMAFADRRAAVARRAKAANSQAGGYSPQQMPQPYGNNSMYGQPQGYVQQPYGQQTMSPYGQPQNPYGQPVRDTSYADAASEADEIGRRLSSEVMRVGVQRRTEWTHAIKVMASSFKEATSERVAIWEAVLEQFDQTIPGYYQKPVPATVTTSVAPTQQPES